VTDPTVRVLGAGLISAAALLPVYIWCRRPSLGLPIFPLFALTYVPMFAYPLAGDDPIITIYDEVAGLQAGLTVSAFLLMGTVAWHLSHRWFRAARGAVRTMPPGKGDTFFSLVIFLAALLTIGAVGHWFQASGGIFSIVRAASTGLASLGMFVLAYRWGAGELDGTKKAMFGASFLLYLVAHSMTLYLMAVTVAPMFALAGYVVGGGRVPWKLGTVMIGLIIVLHAGKSDMRDDYWYYSDAEPVQISDYPSFLAQWLGYGWEVLNSPPRDDGALSFSERLSLVHLLLKVQAETPDKRPYLNGETYAIIPWLFVPRLLNPKKPVTREGNHLLSIHYGLQTREATETSTLAWGPLNEAYANFGPLGVVGLAIVIGSLYGAISKLATGVPILSLRMAIAVIFAALALQVESTAGFYVSSLFQSIVVVWAMSFVLMERRLLRESHSKTHGAARS
jgi:hypothetical protein